MLWEVFNLTPDASADVDFSVLLPQHQVNDYVDNCLERNNKRFDAIRASLATIDVNQALAEDDGDRKNIFARMQRMGLERVNTTVLRVMRNWLVPEG